MCFRAHFVPAKTRKLALSRSLSATQTVCSLSIRVHYTMRAEKEAPPTGAFTFQAMGCRYNVLHSSTKAAYADFDSAIAELLYHGAMQKTL